MSTNQTLISVVVPVFNAGRRLIVLVERILESLAAAGYSCEILLCDDASTDDTWQVILSLRERLPETVRALHFETNMGQIAATQTGMAHSIGDIICTIDDDLQYNPEDILRLIYKLKNTGALIATGRPMHRQHSFQYTVLVNVFVGFLRHILIFRYRKAYFYSSFRAYHRSVLFKKGKFNNYHPFAYWHIPPKKYAVVDVSHFKPLDSTIRRYSFPKFLSHFAAIFLFFLKRLFGFLAIMHLIIWFFLFMFFDHRLSISLFWIFAILSILSCALFSWSMRPKTTFTSNA